MPQDRCSIPEQHAQGNTQVPKMPVVPYAFRSPGPILVGIMAPPPIPRVLDPPPWPTSHQALPPILPPRQKEALCWAGQTLTGNSTGSKTWKPCANHLKDKECRRSSKRTQRAATCAKLMLAQQRSKRHSKHHYPLTKWLSHQTIVFRRFGPSLVCVFS